MCLLLKRLRVDVATYEVGTMPTTAPKHLHHSFPCTRPLLTAIRAGRLTSKFSPPLLLEDTAAAKPLSSLDHSVRGTLPIDA